VKLSFWHFICTGKKQKAEYLFAFFLKKKSNTNKKTQNNLFKK